MCVPLPLGCYSRTCYLTAVCRRARGACLRPQIDRTMSEWWGGGGPAYALRAAVSLQTHASSLSSGAAYHPERAHPAAAGAAGQKRQPSQRGQPPQPVTSSAQPVVTQAAAQPTTMSSNSPQVRSEIIKSEGRTIIKSEGRMIIKAGNQRRKRTDELAELRKEAKRLEVGLLTGIKRICKNLELPPKDRSKPEEQLDADLLRVIAQYQYDCRGYCPTCGPQEDSCTFTPSICTAGCRKAQKRAKKRPVPDEGRKASYDPRKACKRKQCEDCGQRQAYWGMADRKMRWCRPCAQGSHAGSMDLVNAKCEDCKLRSRSWGMPFEGTRRWCAGCGANHEGATQVGGKKCQSCLGPRPSWGPRDAEPNAHALWCGKCGKKHGGISYRGRSRPPPAATRAEQAKQQNSSA
jgi:hypothetical protein